jgi:hypothetical protein
MTSIIKRNKKNGLEPNVIRGFLKLSNISQASIAKELRVSEQAVSQVIDRDSTSSAIQACISDKLNLPYEFVWGLDQEAA